MDSRKEGDMPNLLVFACAVILGFAITEGTNAEDVLDCVPEEGEVERGNGGESVSQNPIPAHTPEEPKDPVIKVDPERHKIWRVA